MSQLQARNISHRFGQRHLFQGLNLELLNGETLCLLGPSGSGKSTLLRIVSGLLQPSAGELSSSSNKASLLFQEPRLLPWRNVEENILLAFELGKNVDQKASRSAKNELPELLGRLGLATEVRHLFPHQLSGGMKMRVALARALITGPDLLFLDEPFSALDEQTRFQLQDELLKIRDHFPNLSILLVTHSISEAVFLSNRCLILNRDGQISKTWTRPKNIPIESELRESENYFLEVRRLSQDFRDSLNGGTEQLSKGRA